MIVKLFAVVDRVTGVFDGPHKAINEGDFMRSFEKLCTDANTAVAQKPEDFYAVALGSFDDSTGQIIPTDGGATRIADATDFTLPKEK